MVLEKTPECPLGSKQIKPVNLKGNQPWILIGRTDAEIETPVFWSSNVNNWLIGKVPDAGKGDGGRGEEGIRGWNGWMIPPMQWTWTWANLGDGEGQRSLVCCSPWGHKELDTTGQLNNNNIEKSSSSNINISMLFQFIELIVKRSSLKSGRCFNLGNRNQIGEDSAHF